jgi:hypothetical protein
MVPIAGPLAGGATVGRAACDQIAVVTLTDWRTRRPRPAHAMRCHRSPPAAEGLTNPAIAERLHLSVSSVEKHVSAIFGKLGLTEPRQDRRVSAVLAWLDHPTP